MPVHDQDTRSVFDLARTAVGVAGPVGADTVEPDRPRDLSLRGTPFYPRPLGTWSALRRAAGASRRPAFHADSVRHTGGSLLFLRNEFPTFRRVVPPDSISGAPGYGVDCNQCVLATDAYLNQRPYRLVRATGWDGPITLQRVYYGTWDDSVHSYDDVIARMEGWPGSRGVVYIERPGVGGSHLFSAVNSTHGIVFLDGQTGRLATLEPGIARIGLMQYHPQYALPAVVPEPTPCHQRYDGP
jgi:Papain fold toxin 1, glutamine deamidase